jgi:predicted acyl esterase
MRKIIGFLALFFTVGLYQQTAVAGSDENFLPIFSFAAGLLNKGVFPTSPLYTTDDDLVIYGDDGVNLEANIFVPTNLSGSAPAIIFINSWALNEYEYLKQAGELAEKGYIVLSYTTRGFGESGGVIDTAGPNDLSDLSNVVDFLIENYPVDPDNIGAGGISYGSGISLLGAAQDSRIKAVAAMSTWGSLPEALYGNQSPRLVWGALLNVSSQLLGEPDPILNQHWQDIKGQNLSAIPDVIAWANVRSPINYVDQLNANGTAVYLGKAYGDHLFQPNSVLEMFGQLTGPKYIDLVSGSHATAEFLPSLVGVGDNVIWDNVYRWFDIHLKGETNALSGAKPLNMKVRFKDQFDGFDDYPIAATSNKKLYLHPRRLFDTGDLETYAFKSWQGRADDTINAWTGTMFSTQIPLLSQTLEQLEIPIYADISAASNIRSIYWESKPLSSSMKIRGTPSLKIRVQPHYDKAQIVAYLYDMDVWGTGKLITHGVFTLPDTDRGKEVTLDFDLVSTAYDVPAGHRLVLAIDTKDPQYKSPTRADYFLDIEYSNSKQSVLTIPAL